MLLRVAIASLFNRKLTVLLTVLSVAVSVAILLGVDHLRSEARNSFSKTVSGVDLIVGARTGQVNLLLYSIFRMGNATNNISWQSYQDLTSRSQVAWSIPISLGDSHRGYRVMGTTSDYFSHFRYGKKQLLAFAQGKPFNGVFDAVIGAEIARELNYQVGQSIVLSHGIGEVSFSKHDDKPFTVVGILKPTGTPVDQTIHVSLEGIEAIHIDWQHGTKIPGKGVSAEQVVNMDLTPKSITAFMLGLKSKLGIFTFQRSVNQYQPEALLAILPGVALSELWQMMGVVEKMLTLISALVLVASLLGMATMLLSSMKERAREIAVLRAMGANPWFIFLLIEMEAILITLVGMVVGAGVLFLGLLATQQWISEHYGLFISMNLFHNSTLYYLGSIIGMAILLALIPAISSYRFALINGLTVNK